MPAQSTMFTAIVLAADRGHSDPVARAAGASCKAMAPVGGTPMLVRVLEALHAADSVTSVILCGPPRAVIDHDNRLQQILKFYRPQWRPSGSSPSTSTAMALETLAVDTPVLLTTADHALLTPAMVDHFCHQARRASADVLVALAAYRDVMDAYPGMRRTATRFQDGPFCGCNLFAILNARGRRAADFWRQVEAERKKPWKMIQKLGWLMVLKYLAGRLTLAEGLERASEMIGLKADAVLMPFPEAAVDVDTPADWSFVERLVRNSG
ncbi:MAG: nucleotidyltransferase family protein [Desulfobacterales bacterium]|nr:nucleotidyltransferase family protein [Desulfobacterales bacterium]MDJ0886918.1 nucleotidyltransferase family protein [Desulfobacterales bacterium]